MQIVMAMYLLIDIFHHIRPQNDTLGFFFEKIYEWAALADASH